MGRRDDERAETNEQTIKYTTRKENSGNVQKQEIKVERREGEGGSDDGTIDSTR